jgi:putative restriction endonuclease
MRFWIGITDKDWFDFLRPRSPDEINFWQPSGKPVASFLAAGTPFPFQLHAPHNFVVGGEFFVRFSALPARLAWEAFGENNGATNHEALRGRVQQYREELVRGDPEIGCNILNGPFFFAEKDWIPTPKSWAPSIVRGRSYDISEADGAGLWGAVAERLRLESTAGPA